MAASPKAVELSTPGAATDSTRNRIDAVTTATGDGAPAPSAAVVAVRPRYTAEDLDVDGELGALPMATATAEVKAAALKRVFVAMFLHVFAWAITIPALSPLLTTLTGSSTDAARALSMLNFAWSGVELCGTLVLGGLSDRHGRHKILQFCLLMSGVGWALFGVLRTVPLLLIAALFRGLVSVGTVVGYACIVDVSPAGEDGTGFGKSMGIFLAVALLALLLGPVVGGVIAAFTSNEVAFFAAGIASVVSAAYVRWFVPETLAHPKLFRWQAVMPHRVMSILVSTPAIRNVAIVFWSVNMCFGPYQLGALYSEMRFGWDALDIGLFLGYAGFTAMITQGVLTPLLLPRLGYLDSMCVGVAFGIFHFGLLGLSSSEWMWYVIVPVTSFLFLAFPATRGYMAKQVPRHMQGRLQGAIGSLNTISTAISPLWAAGVYSLSEHVADAWPPTQGEFHLASSAMWLTSSLILVPVLGWTLYLRYVGP